MCLLLALRRDDGELWVAANRDERLDRPWAPPRLLVADPPVWGGQDLVAGGSWLAVNTMIGFVVALTNARLGARPAERSRGQLVLDAAAQRSAAAAAALLAELDLTRYGAFNLLLADPFQAILATNTPEPRLGDAGAGAIVLGNEPIGEESPRLIQVRAQAATLPLAPSAGWQALSALLTDHSGTDPVCRHGAGYGTVCSTLIAIDPAGRARYEFAPGPPCTTPFSRVAGVYS